MKTFKLNAFDVSENFNLKSVASVQELTNHDLIYVYHHLHTGSEVLLVAEGTNVTGDIRYQVRFKSFLLGYVNLGGYFRPYYENNDTLTARIISIKKAKFLPSREIDIEVDIIKLKNVS